MSVHYGSFFGNTKTWFEAHGESWGSTLLVTGNPKDVTCGTCLTRIVNDLDAKFFDQTSCGRVYSTRIDFSPAPG